MRPRERKGGDVSKVFGPAILEWVWIDPRQNTTGTKGQQLQEFIHITSYISIEILKIEELNKMYHMSDH